MGNIQRKFLNGRNLILLKLRFSKVHKLIFFPENYKRFGTTSKKLFLENYVLEYHTADTDDAEML